MNLVILVKSTTFHHQSGGLETQNKNLAEALADRGHNVWVITPQFKAGVAELAVGKVLYQFVDVNLTGQPGEGYRGSRWWPESLKVFDELARKQRIDLVISQSTAGREVVGQRLVPTLAVAHGTIWGELRSLWQNITGLKSRVHFLTRIIPYGIWIYLKVDQPFYRRVRGVIAVSSAVRNDLSRLFPGLRSKLTVVANGVDPAVYHVDKVFIRQLRRGLGIKPKEIVFLYAGRVEREKGLMVLVEAAAKLHQEGSGGFKVLVVGEGKDRDQLQKMIINKGLDDFFNLIGEVSYTEMPKFYHLADIFVLPTLREEGLPMVVVEAVVSGRPLLTTGKGGVGEAARKGQNALYVNPGDSADLARKMKKILNEPKLLKKLSAGSKKIAARFDRRQMAAEYENVFDRLIKPNQ